MRKSYVHVSFDVVERFIPRIPKSRAIGMQEDDATPRICVSTDIRHALLAVPQSGEVVRYMQMLGMPLVIHAYYLSSDKVYMPTTDDVPDAEATKEHWLLEPPTKVLRRDYELVNPLIINHLCMNGIRKDGIISTGLRPVRFQSNSESLKTALKIPERKSNDYYEAIRHYSFRAVIQILGAEYGKQHTDEKGENIGQEGKNGTAYITA